MTLVPLGPGKYESASGRFYVTVSYTATGFLVLDRSTGLWIAKLFTSLTEVEQAIQAVEAPR